MVGDDGAPAAGHEHVDRLIDGIGQEPQLAVHLDADGLERPLGGVSTAPAGRCGDGGADHLDQLPGPVERASGDDGARQAAGEALATVLVQHAGQLVLGVAVDDVGRGERLPHVHPHVERPVRPVAEAALGSIELWGADSQIEQRTADVPTCPRLMSKLLQRRRDLVERAPAEDHPVREAGQRSRRRVDGLAIAVEADQPQVGPGLEERPCVAACADGRIDHHARRHRPHDLDDLVDHHRPVEERLAHPQPPGRDTVGMCAPIDLMESGRSRGLSTSPTGGLRMSGRSHVPLVSVVRASLCARCLLALGDFLLVRCDSDLRPAPRRPTPRAVASARRPRSRCGRTDR